MSDEKATPGGRPEPKPNYFSILTAPVRYDRTLPANAKLLYSELTALADNEEGYCWAQNGYFAALYGVSDGSIRGWLRALEQKGYITREEVRDPVSSELLERRIYVVKPPSENCRPSVKNLTPPPSKNRRESSTDDYIPPYNPPTGDGAAEKKLTIAQQRELWFGHIFEAYPNHDARSPALKRWLRMKPSLEFARMIYRTVQEQVKAQKWSEGYWPEFRKWLLDERWKDPDRPPPKGSGKPETPEEREYKLV